jgi:hypothetical protein
MRDINLKLIDNNYFHITREQEMPYILQQAIVILMFSNNKAFRPFINYGDSIYEMLSRITDSSVNQIEGTLLALTPDLLAILKQTDPLVDNVNFIVTYDKPALTIELNITYDGALHKQIIYEV